MKFFRSIRRNYLIKFKNIQYFKYAIGEIILVVIGILIALQLNNWDENRKLRKKEVFHIRNLVKEIQDNNRTFRNAIETDSINLIAEKKMLSILKNRNSEYNDSMSYVFYTILKPKPFENESAAYESLKLDNANMIKSDSIRKSISICYGVVYPYFHNEHSKKSKEFLEPIKNIMLRSFERIEVNRIVPNNYEELKKDKSFTNALSFYILERQILLYTKKSLYRYLEKYQLDLENYLTKIEN